MRRLVPLVLLVLASACGASPKDAKHAAKAETIEYRSDEAWMRAMRKIRAARDARELALSDVKDKVDEARFAAVIHAYREAEAAWADLSRDAHEAKNVHDAYEADYFLAEARVNAIELAANLYALGTGDSPPPTFEAIEQARELAISVRDARFDDHRASAALLVVKIADVPRDLAYVEYKKSNGARGIELRDQAEMEGSRPKLIELPPEIDASIRARREFVRKVPSAADEERTAPIFRAWVGRTLFVYGHWIEARRELEALMRDECGKSPSGYIAWITLMQAAAMSGDAARARALADGAREQSCAVGDAQKSEEAEILDTLAKGLSRRSE